MDSAISLAQDGLYGKACQVLTSPGIAPHTEETWRLLLSKHPESGYPIAPPLPDVDTPISIPTDLNIMVLP